MPRRKLKLKRCPHCKGPLKSAWGEGPKPYGEDPRRPWESEGVREIMAGKARGETYRRIAEHMQACGFKLRRGKRWNPGTVWRVIRRREAAEKKAEKQPDMIHVSEVAFYPSAGDVLNAQGL